MMRKKLKNLSNRRGILPKSSRRGTRSLILMILKSLTKTRRKKREVIIK